MKTYKTLIGILALILININALCISNAYKYFDSIPICKNSKHQSLDIRVEPNTILYRVNIYSGNNSSFNVFSLNRYYSNQIGKDGYNEETYYDELFGFFLNNGTFESYKSDYQKIKFEDSEFFIRGLYTLELIVNELEYYLLKDKIGELNNLKGIDVRSKNQVIKDLCNIIGLKMPKKINSSDYLNNFLKKAYNNNSSYGHPDHSKKGYNLELLNGYYVKKFNGFDYVGELKKARYPHGKGSINQSKTYNPYQGVFNWKKGTVSGRGILYSRIPPLISFTLTEDHYNNDSAYYITNASISKTTISGPPLINGFAQIKSPSGIIYEGNWENGNAIGDFNVTLKNGGKRIERFDGYGNRPTGKIYLTENSYVEITNPEPGSPWAGQGIWVHPDFEYSGAIVNLLPNGKGVYKFKDGTELSGISINGLINGVATYTYKNKDYCLCKYSYGSFLGGPIFKENGERKYIKKYSSYSLNDIPKFNFINITADIEGDIKNPGKIVTNVGNQAQTTIEQAGKVVDNISNETCVFVSNVGKELERGWENGTIQKVAILIASFYVGPEVFEFDYFGWQNFATTLTSNDILSKFLNVDSEIADKSEEAILTGIKKVNEVVDPIIDNLKNALCSIAGLSNENCDIDFLMSIDFSDEVIAGLGENIEEYYHYYKNTYLSCLKFINEIPNNQIKHQKLIDNANNSSDNNPVMNMLINASCQFYSTMMFSSDLIKNGNLSDIEFSNICAVYNGAVSDYKSILTIFSTKHLLVDQIEDESIRNIIKKITEEGKDGTYISSSKLDNYLNKKALLVQGRSPAYIGKVLVGAMIAAGTLSYKIYKVGKNKENYDALREKLNNLKTKDKENYRKYIMLELTLEKIYFKSLQKSVNDVTNYYYVDVPKSIANGLIKSQSKVYRLISDCLRVKQSQEKIKNTIEGIPVSEFEKELKLIEKELNEINKN